MDELKPCPFCGKSAAGFIDPEFPENIFIGCEHCDSVGEPCQTEEGAIRAWNTRPIEDALRTENQRLREAGDAMFEVLTRAEHALETAESDFMEIQEVCQDIDMTQQDWACLTALAGEEAQP